MSIRILHLGNLAIHAGNSEEVFRNLAKLAERYDLAGSINYLVVCGDVTADGSEAAFRKAAEVLERLVSLFVLPDEVKANRLLVVPGPRDVGATGGGTADSAPFAAFCNELSKRCFQMESDWKNGVFRDLKDLTLIGLPYWSGANEARSQNIKDLDSDLQSLSVQGVARYINSTPTILATAETPLQIQSPGFPDETLRSLFSLPVNITIHLFGAGDRALLAPEPFLFDHYSLGVGACGDETSTLLRANLLELKPSHAERTALYSPEIDIRFFRLPGRAQEWDEREHSLPVNRRTRLSHVESPYSKLFQEILRSKLSDSRARGVMAVGFPGCGLPYLFDHLEKTEAERSSDVRLFCHEWKDDESWGEFLKKRFADWDGGRSGSGVIVVFDRQFRNLSGQERRRRLEKIYEGSSTLLSRKIKVLFLAEHPDPAWVPKEFYLYRTGALDTRALSEFLKPYEHRLPLEESTVGGVTGGYAGFGEQLLEDATDRFSKWPGAKPISSEAPVQLIQESLRNGDIRRDFDSFIDTAAAISGGFPVIDHIRKELRGRYDQARLELLRQVSSEVDFAELFTSVDSSYAHDFRRHLKHLEDHGILVKGERDTQRRIRMLGPFLCKRVYRVFLSYPGRLEELAQKFKDALLRAADKELATVIVEDYKAKGFRNENPDIREDLRDKLRRARNLCLIQIDGVVGGSEMVQFEIDTWRELKQQEQAQQDRPDRISAELIFFPGGGAPSLFLPDSTPIVVAKEEQIPAEVDKLFGRLIPSERVWY